MSDIAEHIRTWGIALCTAAIVSGVLQIAAGESIARRGLRFAAGLYLVFALMKPLSGLSQTKIGPPFFEGLSFSAEYAEEQQTSALLAQTNRQLQQELNAFLNNMGIQPISVETQVNIDGNDCIYLDKADVLLAKEYRSRHEEITKELVDMLGIQPNIQYEDG